MKEKRIEILQKVANGKLTPEQADEQILGLYVVGSSALYEGDFECPHCGSNKIDVGCSSIVSRVNGSAMTCEDCGFKFG